MDDDPQIIYVASRWVTVDRHNAERPDDLTIGMISTDEALVREFADRHGYDVTEVEDGEEFPSI